MAMGPTGSLFVADYWNHRIREVTSEGMVSTFAGSENCGLVDGVGTAAQFYYPYDVAVDEKSNVYVSDWYNNRIRKITPTGLVSTILEITKPRGLSLSGTSLYIAGECDQKTKSQVGGIFGSLSPTGEWTLIAGGKAKEQIDGVGIEAGFFCPSSMWVGDNYVYVYDWDCIRVIT